MYALIKKARDLDLPIDLQLEMFDATVAPIILYGSEIWGYENLDIIEKLQKKFCKFILKLKDSTPTCIAYGELGRYPLTGIIKSRMISFWCKLRTGKKSKLSCKVYQALFNLYQSNIYRSPWLKCIHNILNSCGLSNLWNSMDLNSTWLVNTVKQRVKDQYLQEWHAEVQESPICYNYRLFKQEFGFEKYLTDLPYRWRFILCKFRTLNHGLPVEKGRYLKIPRHQRYCNLCSKQQLGDEYHYLFECEELEVLRLDYIPKYYRSNHNTIKYKSLMCSETKVLCRLCKFISGLFIMVN